MSTAGTADTMRTARPKIASAVRIGPGLWDGDRQMYTLHDSRTGWYYRVGQHEHFLVSCMDGERTVDEIERAFAEKFERRLTPALWQSIFTLLSQRGLLVGTDDPTLMERLRDTRASQLDRSRTLLHARLPLARPERLLDVLATWMRPIDRFPVWLAVWIAVAGAVAYALVQWDTIIPQALTLWTQPVALVMFFLISWGSMALHELGHGVTARIYGAQGIEIGVMWRLPMVAAYCKVDDSLLFHERSRRVRIALSGVTVSVAVCVPFVVVHWLSGGHGAAGTLSAAMLTFGMMFGLVNILPIFKLDGYYVLSHLLDVSSLDESARRELVRLVRPKKFTKPPGAKRAAYLAYGVGAYLLQTVLVVTMLVFAYRGIAPHLGAGAALVVIFAVIVLAVLTGAFFVRRSRRKLAALPGTQAPSHSKWGNT